MEQRSFAESTRLLYQLGPEAAQLAPDALGWQVAAGESRGAVVRTLAWLVAKLLETPGRTPPMTIKAPRPVDVDGKAIYLDEHDAPFVLLPDATVVHVQVFRAEVDGASLLLTEPVTRAPRRHVPPEERTRRALTRLVTGVLAQRARCPQITT